ncbi:zwei Ig domain protein zig-8-like [Hetaerina americana]|uniref:zwei Ig domain protein zig-8-like n=1 Tax=Hetaerina americana TaxID=62018 RepID=UPI003A7F2D81
MKRICLFTIMQIVTCLSTDTSLKELTSHTPSQAPFFPTKPHTVAAQEPPSGAPRVLPPPAAAMASGTQSPPPSPGSRGDRPQGRRIPGRPPPPTVPAYPTAQGGRTDSPMLGYIFDAHSSLKQHHHHDHRWGPHFEGVEAINCTNITVQVGSTASLNCRISLLQDKTVSWVRRKNGDLQLLTVGLHTYSGDSRYTMEFQYPNNWRLQIKYANKMDEGLYECQISTHPPKVIQIYMHINAPEVQIIDEHGRPLFEKYYKADSTIQLTCIVRHVSMTSSYVTWIHGESVLNYDTTRGGISVKTDLMDEGANSTLSVARADKPDSGNYTCSISPTEFATVAVHVLNGENPAELHHGSGSPSCVNASENLVLLLLTFLLIHATAIRKTGGDTVVSGGGHRGR